MSPIKLVTSDPYADLLDETYCLFHHSRRANFGPPVLLCDPYWDHTVIENQLLLS